MHKIAVLIDVQNMNANTPHDVLFKMLESTGRIEVRKAYAEWKSVCLDVEKALSRNHVRREHMTCTTATGKNAVDMQIVIDTMNVLHEQDKLDTFVLVSGDMDYIPLITEIAGRGKRCIVAAHEGRIGGDTLQ